MFYLTELQTHCKTWLPGNENPVLHDSTNVSSAYSQSHAGTRSACSYPGGGPRGGIMLVFCVRGYTEQVGTSTSLRLPIVPTV